MRAQIMIGALISAAALAGTLAKDNPTNATPSAATDGVSLVYAHGCRISARLDAGVITAGRIAPYYYDSVLGWVRSQTASDCLLESGKTADAGNPGAQVCDYEVVAQFGRLGAQCLGCTTSQTLADGGTATPTPNVRVECWGPSLP